MPARSPLLSLPAPLIHSLDTRNGVLRATLYPTTCRKICFEADRGAVPVHEQAERYAALVRPDRGIYETWGSARDFGLLYCSVVSFNTISHRSVDVVDVLWDV